MITTSKLSSRLTQQGLDKELGQWTWQCFLSATLFASENSGIHDYFF